MFLINNDCFPHPGTCVLARVLLQLTEYCMKTVSLEGMKLIETGIHSISSIPSKCDNPAVTLLYFLWIKQFFFSTSWITPWLWLVYSENPDDSFSVTLLIENLQHRHWVCVCVWVCVGWFFISFAAATISTTAPPRCSFSPPQSDCCIYISPKSARVSCNSFWTLLPPTVRRRKQKH